VISPTQRPLPDNTRHSQETDNHDRGGIRTHNPSKRAAADPRLRTRGHWDRQSEIIPHLISLLTQNALRGPTITQNIYIIVSAWSQDAPQFRHTLCVTDNLAHELGHGRHLKGWQPLSTMTARTQCHLPRYVLYVSPRQKLLVSGADSFCPEYMATGMTIVFEEERVGYSLFRKYRICPKPNVEHFYKSKTQVSK
jgi:hypothetical protein